MMNQALKHAATATVSGGAMYYAGKEVQKGEGKTKDMKKDEKGSPKSGSSSTMEVLSTGSIGIVSAVRPIKINKNCSLVYSTVLSFSYHRSINVH